jgi:hypothetical protein
MVFLQNCKTNVLLAIMWPTGEPIIRLDAYRRSDGRLVQSAVSWPVDYRPMGDRLHPRSFFNLSFYF